MSVSTEDQVPRVEGVPTQDGYYWYYKRGAVLPSLVMIGTRGSERFIKDGPSLQRYRFPGEFFVGPVVPPFATPDDIASAEGVHGEEIWIDPVSGPAISAE